MSSKVRKEAINRSPPLAFSLTPELFLLMLSLQSQKTTKQIHFQNPTPHTSILIFVLNVQYTVGAHLPGHASTHLTPLTHLTYTPGFTLRRPTIGHARLLYRIHSSLFSGHRPPLPATELDHTPPPTDTETGKAKSLRAPGTPPTPTSLRAETPRLPLPSIHPLQLPLISPHSGWVTLPTPPCFRPSSTASFPTPIGATRRRPCLVIVEVP